MSSKSKGLIPPGLAYLADNIISKHNILGDAKRSRSKWAKDIKFSKETDTIFFAGCGYQYSSDLVSLMSLMRGMDKSKIGAELPMGMAGLQKKLGIDLGGVYRKVTVRGNEADTKPLKDAVTVLNKLGIEFGYLGEDEPCCGGLLHYIGLERDFVKNTEDVRKVLKSRGVKRIIGLVPSCTYTLSNFVASQDGGSDLEVKHFIQIVAENLGSRKLQFSRQVKVVYHDPCQLSRFMGVIEEPRQVLSAIEGVELVSSEGTEKEWSTCCGGGGGFEAVFPELSHILAVNRTKELLDTGADTIVTHCPGCILQLKAGLKELGSEKIEVLDLAEVVAGAM